MARPVKNDLATIAARMAMKSKACLATGCVLWTGAKDTRGYGKIGIRDADGVPKTIAAHRMAYRMKHGDYPAGQVVMHTCDNPSCVNPEHLVAGSQADNLADMWTKGRANPGLIPPDARSNSKLTWAMVEMIRTSPTPSKQLAKELSVSDVLIYRVRNGQGWKGPTT